MHPVIRLIRLMTRKTKLVVVIIITIVILESASTIASPKIVELIIDQVFYDREIKVLIPLLLIAVGIAVSKALFLFIQRFLNAYVAQNVVYIIRNKFYSKIQRQSIDFFDRIETGQLISRGTSDVIAIQQLMSNGFRIFLSAIALYSGIFVMIGISDWVLLLIVIASAIFLFAIMYGYIRKSRPLFRTIQNKFGDLNSVLSENVRAARVVRAFAAEQTEIAKFEQENEQYYQLSLKLARFRSLMNVVFPFILSFGSFLLLLIGGKAVILGNLRIGTLIAINSYLLLLRVPTRNMTFAIINYQEGIAAMNRIFEIIDMEKKIKNKVGAIELPPVKGKIQFRNVTFAYREGEEPVLRNISLKISPGETVAFLGTTGSGKSTIVSLVPRFYDPQEGEILIDDYNIRDVTIESLRKQIALVQQEAFLFARTIRENIAFGKPNATDEEIIRAAKIAQAHDFIMSLPEGYDTHVGERGETLSGGQKQRLTIARAILLDCPILIMDDSSSALDFETEHQFQTAIKELIKGRTTLIVTQRLSTIKYATKIVVLDKGKIVEEGTHKELMQRKGLYKYLYETQLMLQAEPPIPSNTTFTNQEKKPKQKHSKAKRKGED
ncbi:MAG: ABC transporter ATP-binding protein/permease [Candidatus Heimdallarchaeota archaeon]|nr:ABC transporter ATP-binding protein/permease [Candidatus Heimdallarchaeota archaeon]